MEFKLLYWYWLVFGMILIIAELFIPSFTIFWFGLGAILEAEGRLEASKRDAQAKVVLAEASQRAITKVTDAIKDNELPVMFLLGEKYIDALKNLSTSENSKVIVLPGDIPAAIRGIISAVGK